MIRYLNDNEKSMTRELYEQAFEDPKTFLDYYYAERVQDRQILADIRLVDGREKVCAMMHLCKRKMLLFQKEVYGCYIYAVATDRDFRRQGLMEGLFDHLKANAPFSDLSFYYLVPMNPEVYKKAGFHSVGMRYKGKKSTDMQGIQIRKATKTDIPLLIALSEMQMEEVQLATLRDEAYFDRMFRQYEVEGSYFEILTEKKEDGRSGYRTIAEGKVIEEFYPEEWKEKRILKETTPSVMVYGAQEFEKQIPYIREVQIYEEV